MNRVTRDKLEKVLSVYFKDIHKIYTDGDFREESFYPSFKRLIEDCSKLYQSQVGVNVLVAPRKTEAGIPDFRIGKDGEILDWEDGLMSNHLIQIYEDGKLVEKIKGRLPYLFQLAKSESSLTIKTEMDIKDGKKK
jgi:hypothetical protein